MYLAHGDHRINLQTKRKQRVKLQSTWHLVSRMQIKKSRHRIFSDKHVCMIWITYFQESLPKYVNPLSRSPPSVRFLDLQADKLTLSTQEKVNYIVSSKSILKLSGASAN